MRKAILFVLSLLMAISPCFSQRTQKVGLVLSGGGARGLAHIGAIQALEENNIPIDYVAGSSVGAIVGALYASGYSVEQMKGLFLSEDFQRWLSGKVDKNYSYFYKENEKDPALVTFTFDTKNKFRFQIPSSVVNPIQMDYALMEIFAGASAVANNNFDSLMFPFFCITSDIEAGKSSIRRKIAENCVVKMSKDLHLII
jgi:NTE family protein